MLLSRFVKYRFDVVCPRQGGKKNERNADMSVAGPAAGWILAASPVLGKICLPHEGQADTATFINQWFIGGLCRPTSKTT